MNNIKFFKDLNKESVSLAGGKGASLGEMINSNFPVPNGFVVLSSAFDNFIEANNLNLEIKKILCSVDINNSETSLNASKKISDLILSKPLSKELEEEILNSFNLLDADFVAVRSSATAEDSATDAWAGQLDTFLNTKKEDLLFNVKKCFASLFTDRAIIYRIDKKLIDKKISVAVIVQKMINSEKSGIAFSVHPVTNDYDQIIIDAGYGLGEAIVSGQITPDSYIISKKHKILDKQKGSQEKALYRSSKTESGNVWQKLSEDKLFSFVLTDNEILELSKIILAIENHYKFPVDVEWAIENGKIFITQSRPITTLEQKKHRLVKLFTREHAIFYSYIRKEAEYNNIKKYCGKALEDVLDIYLPKTNIIAHYYRDDLNEQTNSFLSQKYEQDNDYFVKVKKDIYEYWDKVGPYLQKQNKIETIKELKQFYKDMIDYHTRVSVINVTPDAYVLPKKARDFCLDVRKETQYFVDGYDEVMLDFFSRKFPEYNDIIYHMLPEEIFSLENKKLTEIEIENIKKRKENGSFIFNTTFYDDLKDLKTLLEEHNLELDDLSIIEQKKIELQKLFIRERNLFFMAMEYMTNYADSNLSILGDKLRNFMYLSKKGLVDCLYDVSEIQKMGSIIIEKSKLDPNFFKIIFQKIDNYWPTAKSYLDGSKNITSIDELKEFYNNYFECLTYLTIIYICPEMNGLDEKYKLQALEYRLKTQEVINNFGNVIDYLFENVYTEYKALKDYMLPEEIFILDQRKLNTEEIKIIEDRKENGYVFFRGAVSPYKDLLHIIKESDISIPESYYKTKMQKEHSRAYSFFRIFSIYQAELDLYKMTAIPKKEMGFIFKGKDVVDVYYQIDQLKELFFEISKNAISSSENVKKEIDIFLELFEKLYQYYKGSKKIETIEEFREIFDLYSKYCIYVGLVYIYPNMENISKDLRDLALAARAKTQEYNESLEIVIKDFFKRKYPHLAEHYRFILPKEVWNKDIENKDEILKRIDQRKKGYILYANKLYIGDLNRNLEELGLVLDDHDGSEIKEIKGQIAYKGKIIGIVRIITSQKQISEFQEGEILVSPMTMPNYLSAIKKASAIVTDEGGITCHASIISRELKKACVIGTKIATQVLKNGDLVEVDADNGVVKILNE